jgi:hypothetical protein
MSGLGRRRLKPNSQGFGFFLIVSTTDQLWTRPLPIIDRGGISFEKSLAKQNYEREEEHRV